MPTIDPGSPEQPIKKPEMRDMPFFVLSSRVIQDRYTADNHVGIGNRHLSVVKPGIKVELRVWDRDQKMIREYDIEGTVGEMRTKVPPKEGDAILVEALSFIDILDNQAFGISDMREVVRLALVQTLEQEDSNPLMQDRLVRLHKSLGGDS